MPWPSRPLLLAAACLAGSLALAVQAVRLARRVESVHPPRTAEPLADPAETAARLRELAGTYATGGRTGDRTITLPADGRLELAEIGRDPGATVIAARATLARSGRQQVLLVDDGEPIEILNLGTLLYYRDTYRRR